MTPRLDLPPEPHLPGMTPRPPEGYFDPVMRGLSADMTPDQLAAHPAFDGGLQAMNRGYYWEAHELLEAVWMRLPPACAERYLVGGLIQIANAGLKLRMGRETAARRIMALADARLHEAFLHGQTSLMGLTAKEVSRHRMKALASR